MEELLHHIVNVALPVLLCVLLGFVLAKLKQPFDSKIVGALVSDVGYPTLILGNLANQHIALAPFLNMMLAAATAVVCFGIIAGCFIRILGLPVRAFLSPMMFNNVGNIGIPICTLALGQQGLAYALSFAVVVLVGIFTIGLWLPMGKVTWRQVLTSPVIYAVLVTLVIMATGVSLPETLQSTLNLLSGLAIPLMLLTLGYSLSSLRIGSLWRGIYLALFHLAMASLVAFSLSHIFSFGEIEGKVFILQCLMPVSVATYLWVQIYRPEHAKDISSLILVSTLLTVAVLPMVLTYWL